MTLTHNQLEKLSKIIPSLNISQKDNEILNLIFKIINLLPEDLLIILSSLNYDRVVCKNNKSRLKISSHFKISNDGRRLKHSTIIPKNLIEEYETNPEIKKIFQSLNLNGRKNKQSSSSDASFTKSSKSSSKSSGESKYSDWKQERRQKSDDYQKLTAAGVKRKLTNGSIDGTRSNILRSKSIENQLPDKNPCITILSSDEDINRTLTASSVKNQSQTTQKVNNLQTSLEVIDLENYQPRAKSSSNRTIISSIYPSSSSSRSNSTSIYNFRKEQAESITKVGSNYTIFDDISKDWGTVNSRTNEVEDKEIHCIKVINEIDESVPEFFMYEKGTKIKRNDFPEIRDAIVKKYIDKKRKCECRINNINARSSTCIKNCPCNKYYKIFKVNDRNDSNFERNIIVLKADYLKKHKITDPDIWECNSACECDPDLCCSRPVKKFERNIAVKVMVKKTKERGFGLFANEKIYKGQYIGPYQGEMSILRETEASTRDDTYIFLSCEDLINEKGEMVVIDSRKRGNASRFINHSCEQNIIVYYILHPRAKYPIIGLFAMQDIEIGEELFLDYTDKYWEIKNKKGMFCCCDSPGCYYSREMYEKRKPIKKTQEEETNTSELEADNTINKENSLKLHNSQSTCTEEEDNIKKRPRPILSSTSSLSTASNSDNWPACRSKLKSNKRKRVKPD